MIRFADLFAGIGGLRLGFESACDSLGIEHKCVFSSEIDKRAVETYKSNFNETPEGDIRQIHTFPPCDFILAGFPCQTFSYAGKREGFGDTRGTLFFEIERMINSLNPKPKGLLLENVRGLLTHDHGRTIQTITSRLEGMGYGVQILLLNSSSFGVPQNRMRIYILCLLGDKPLMTIASNKGASDSHKFKIKKNQTLLTDELAKTRVIKDILEHTPDKKYVCSAEFKSSLSVLVDGDFNRLHGVRLIDYRNGSSIHSWELGMRGKCTKKEISLMNAIISNRRKKIFGKHQDGKKLTLEQIRTFYHDEDIMKTIRSLIDKGYLQEQNGKYNPVCGNMSFEVFKFLDPESISITVVSSDAHRLGVVQNGVPRRITPRECARLQGFPDTFKLHPNDTSMYKQIGNSVSVPVVDLVARDFLKNNWIKPKHKQQGANKVGVVTLL